MQDFINKIFEENQIQELYEQYRKIEKETKETLIEFEKEYPDVVNVDNLNDIIYNLRNRR